MKWKENRVLANRNKWFISLWKHTRFLLLWQQCSPFQNKVSFCCLWSCYVFHLQSVFHNDLTLNHVLFSYSQGTVSYALNPITFWHVFCSHFFCCISQTSKVPRIFWLSAWLKKHKTPHPKSAPNNPVKCTCHISNRSGWQTAVLHMLTSLILTRDVYSLA